MRPDPCLCNCCDKRETAYDELKKNHEYERNGCIFWRNRVVMATALIEKLVDPSITNEQKKSAHLGWIAKYK